MTQQYKTRIGTAADFASQDPELASNEIAIESDTGKVKFGGGTFSSLPYSDFNLMGATVEQATESISGIAEIATQAEVNTGSDDQRIVTPLKLKTALTAAIFGFGTNKNIESDGSGILIGTTKLTAFNKNFGSAAGTVVEGNDSRLSDSRPPSGAAGGDLTGSFPNPTLAAIITAGSKGASNKSVEITYDAKGRITAITELSISITESQVNNLVADLAAKEVTINRNRPSGGYVGTGANGDYTIDFLNGAGTFISFLKNTNTAIRQYNFQDRNGTILDDTDKTYLQDQINLKGSKIYQAEIDFGSVPVSEGVFNVPDSNVSAGMKVTASIAYEAPTGKDLDEIECDDLIIKGTSYAGGITLFIKAADGSYLADKFKVNYNYN
jgi:hypothetical protein